MCIIHIMLNNQVEIWVNKPVQNEVASFLYVIIIIIIIFIINAWRKYYGGQSGVFVQMIEIHWFSLKL